MPKCFKCEKDMVAAVIEDEEAYIWEMPDGLLFEGGATFGSAVYDSMINGIGVQLLVCDDCLKANKPLLREVSDGYELGQINGSPFIKCKRCHRTSFNPSDIEHKYCGHCRKFHER